MTDANQDHHQEFLRAFTRHEPALRAFVRRLVPTRVDADDILQEVAIILWEKFDQFDSAGSFYAWACGIARYKVLSWLRDKGRERMLLSPEVIELLADHTLDTESHLKEQRLALEHCFEKITPVEQDLLARAYSPDSQVQEVASSSGRSVSGFYQWLYRMRQLLLDCIQRRMAQESSV